MLHILHRHRAVLPFTAALLCLVFLAGCGAADKEMTDGEGADESGEEIVSVSSGLLAAVTLDDLMLRPALWRKERLWTCRTHFILNTPEAAAS